MSKKRILLGKWGEEQAVDYLNKLGYKICETNFRCNMGEIDIIALDKEILSFIEVKTRKTDSFGDPAEAVNYHKQKKIAKVAMYYLIRNNLDKIECRFDVITVKKTINSKIEIEHYKDAFDV